MSLSTASDVRALGNLPPVGKLPDAIIQPHLDSAGRELKTWIGDYSAATGEKVADCKEAECCICLAYLLPVLNTLYTNGVVSLQKEIGDVELMFHSPEDLQLVAERWLARAKARVAQHSAAESGGASVRFYAI